MQQVPLREFRVWWRIQKRRLKAEVRGPFPLEREPGMMDSQGRRCLSWASEDEGMECGPVEEVTAVGVGWGCETLKVRWGLLVQTSPGRRTGTEFFGHGLMSKPH